MNAEQSNGTAKIVATFTVECDEQGSCRTKVSGPFPMVPLFMALEMAQENIKDQMKFQQQQEAMKHQQNKRVLLPDGSLPPHGL